jgi:hypothetical protein
LRILSGRPISASLPPFYLSNPHLHFFFFVVEGTLT